MQPQSVAHHWKCLRQKDPQHTILSRGREKQKHARCGSNTRVQNASPKKSMYAKEKKKKKKTILG
jgi:hypothetical protein